MIVHRTRRWRRFLWRRSFRSSHCFFFNDTATTEIYTLSLHDALPIWHQRRRQDHRLSPDRGPTAGALIRATIYLTKRAGAGTIEVWNAPQNRSASRKQWSTSRTPTTAASTLWRGAGPTASNAPLVDART